MGGVRECMRCRYIALTLAVVSGLRAQPRFDKDHVIPFGSRRPGHLTRGQFVTIVGWNLTPTTPCQKSGQQQPPYPTEVCGVRVMIGDSAAALMYLGSMGNQYIKADQINFQIPLDGPTEGRAPLRVCVNGQCSSPVHVEFTSKDILLTLHGKARARLPIWIAVEIPMNPHFSYPFGLCPWNFGGYEVNVRKDGVLLPGTEAPRCAHESKQKPPLLGSARIPLHLVHRFDSPGAYEIRVRGPILTPDLSKVARVGTSEWHRIEVEATTEDERKSWLREMAEKATDPSKSWRQSGDLTASLLAWPDEQVLATLVRLLPPSPARVKGGIAYSGRLSK
jgi:hypothetical protein